MPDDLDETEEEVRLRLESIQRRLEESMEAYRRRLDDNGRRLERSWQSVERSWSTRRGTSTTFESSQWQGTIAPPVELQQGLDSAFALLDSAARALDVPRVPRIELPRATVHAKAPAPAPVEPPRSLWERLEEADTEAALSSSAERPQAVPTALKPVPSRVDPLPPAKSAPEPLFYRHPRVIGLMVGVVLGIVLIGVWTLLR